MTPDARARLLQLVETWNTQAAAEYKAARQYRARSLDRAVLLHTADTKTVCAHELEKDLDALLPSQLQENQEDQARRGKAEHQP